MDAITEWMSAKADSLEPRDLVQYLMATAALNYKPASSSALFQVSISYCFLLESTWACRTSVQVTRDRLTPDSWKGSDEVWLDVVRSWCALDLQQAEHLKSVLNPEFAGRLMNNANCKFQDVSKARR